MTDWQLIPGSTCGSLGAPGPPVVSGWPNNTVSKIVLPFDKTAISAILGAASGPIPDNFTWQGKPGIEAGGSRNQEQLGTCFAFGICGALGDRYAIKYKLSTPPMPSPLWITSGVTQTPVCLNRSAANGGVPQLALQWVENNFVKSESCFPYSTLITAQ